MMMNMLLSRFIASPQSIDLAATAAHRLLSLDIHSVEDLYRDSEAFKTGYNIGYRAEKARLEAKK